MHSSRSLRRTSPVARAADMEFVKAPAFAGVRPGYEFSTREQVREYLHAPAPAAASVPH